jgi:hypothetical protein
LGVELFGVVLVINLRCFAAAAALWFFLSELGLALSWVFELGLLRESLEFFIVVFFMFLLPSKGI